MTEITIDKKGLHPRNIHNKRYDFSLLMNNFSELKKFVSKNKFGDLSVDYSNPEAVLTLNKSLLSYFYKIKEWNFPQGHLCPPIPGRVDYIHYMADLLSESNSGKIPTGKKVKVLDIGTGATCIYPLLGNSVYGWRFVGVDIDSDSVNTAKKIIKSNPHIKNNIKCRYQKDSQNIFDDVIGSEERFDFTLCNPPFHSSLEEALEGSAQKIKNLNTNKQKKGLKAKSKDVLNFGGKKAELWCPGGEIEFIKRMIHQSKNKDKQCFWFSTLVSKKENLATIYDELKKIEVKDVKTIDMNQGQKKTRIVAWTFLSKDEQILWSEKNW